MGNATIKVVIADDHELVRAAIKVLLAEVQDIQIVGESSCGEDVVILAQQVDPDIIIMDIKMPGIGGLEAARRCLQHKPNLKILILTVCEDGPMPWHIVRAGVAGYLTKDANLNELVTAIRKVYAGESYIAPIIAERIALGQQGATEVQTTFSQLSDREMQVFWMIMQGYSAQAIAEKLFLSAKTVNHYRYSLFKKFNAKSDVELTHLALNNNFAE